MEDTVLVALDSLFEGVLGAPPPEMQGIIYVFYMLFLFLVVALIFRLFELIFEVVFRWRS